MPIYWMEEVRYATPQEEQGEGSALYQWIPERPMTSKEAKCRQQQNHHVEARNRTNRGYSNAAGNCLTHPCPTTSEKCNQSDEADAPSKDTKPISFAAWRHSVPLSQLIAFLVIRTIAATATRRSHNIISTTLCRVVQYADESLPRSAEAWKCVISSPERACRTALA